MAFPHCAGVCRIDRGQDFHCGPDHVQPGSGSCPLFCFLSQFRLIQSRWVHCHCGNSPGSWLFFKNKSGGQSSRNSSHGFMSRRRWRPLEWQPFDRAACFRGCSVANLPRWLPWTARHRRSSNSQCHIPPKTRRRCPVLSRDFRGDGRGDRANVQLYAGRMDISIQPD